MRGFLLICTTNRRRKSGPKRSQFSYHDFLTNLDNHTIRSEPNTWKFVHRRLHVINFKIKQVIKGIRCSFHNIAGNNLSSGMLCPEQNFFIVKPSNISIRKYRNTEYKRIIHLKNLQFVQQKSKS